MTVMPTVDDTILHPDILAQRIKDARVASRLSQTDLAIGIGVSDKSISAYEQGRSVPPFDKLRKIATMTKHTLTYFTEENNLEGAVASKLASIERELQEVKNLIKNSGLVDSD